MSSTLPLRARTPDVDAQDAHHAADAASSSDGPAIDLEAARQRSLVELLLRHRADADALCADRAEAARLLPRLLGLSTIAIAAFACVQGAVLGLSAQDVPPEGLVGAPLDVAIPSIFLAYELALTGAQVAGLPTFTFYGLMAGFQTHAWRIAVESARARATAAVVLIGLLPVYLTVALGLLLLHDAPSPAGEAWHGLVLVCGGFCLPFVAGLAAPASLLRVFRALAAASAQSRGGRRRPMPVLLAFAWSAVFTAMAPLGVFRVLHLLVG